MSKQKNEKALISSSGRTYSPPVCAPCITAATYSPPQRVSPAKQCARSVVLPPASTGLDADLTHGPSGESARATPRPMGSGIAGSPDAA